MNKLAFRTYLPLLWLLAIPMLSLIYLMLNKPVSNVANLMTALDNSIPFLPVFAIPYMLWYPFLLVCFILLLKSDRNLYYRTLLTLCVGMLASFLVYTLFQTTVPRPALDESNWLHALAGIVYAGDAPYNCFPSIHVLTSHIMLKAAYHSNLRPAIKRSIFAIAWTIMLSTLFMKQHALLDLAGAVLLSELLFYAIDKLRLLTPAPVIKNLTVARDRIPS